MTRLIVRQGRSIAGLPTISNSSHDPNNTDNRDDPRGQEGNRNANHSQAPHDRRRTLSNRAAQGGEESGVRRDDVALAVNLNLEISRRVGFVDLPAAIL